MRGVPRERPAISADPSSVSSTPSRAALRAQHLLQLGRLVELHLADEAEAVPQRAGEQARRGSSRRPG